MSVLAIDVGGTTIKAEVLDDGARVRTRRCLPTPRGHAVIDAVTRLIDELGHVDTPVGLAVPGVVDATAGVGVYSANLGWRDLPITRLVEDATGVTPALVHDVTAAGVAEHTEGAARGFDDVAVVVIGTGLAAALVVQGRLLRGHPIGEIGHLPLIAGGPTCACGRTGCVEAVASAGAIHTRYEQLTGRSVEDAAAVEELLDIDAVARSVWQDAVTGLADGLLALTAIVGTRRVVISGGLSNAGQLLLEPLRTALADRATAEHPPDVVIGRFGDRSVLVGAALAAGMASP